MVWLMFTVFFQAGKIFYNFLPSTLHFSVLLEFLIVKKNKVIIQNTKTK